MALKRKISKADFDALPDVIKAEYKQSGNDYVLDTDDATELMSARDAEKEKRRKAEKDLADAQAALDALKDDNARKSGDVEALDRSWKTKYDALVAERDNAVQALDAERQDRYVTSEADKIAAKFTVPSLVRPLIAGRLKAEVADGKGIVRVLDKEGKPSALSLGDLEKEFIDNPEFKGIVIAGKGSGGSAPQPGAGGSASNFQIPTSSDGSPKRLTTMSPKEIAAQFAETGE